MAHEVVSQSVSSGQRITWLLAEVACVHFSIHYVLGQHCVFTPLHYLFLVFHIFSIIEKLCWGHLASRQKWAISIVMESSHAAGSIYSQWQWLDESTHPLPPPPTASLLSCPLLCAAETVNIFQPALMENVTFTRRIIYSSVLFTWGCVLCDVHEWEAGLLI